MTEALATKSPLITAEEVDLVRRTVANGATDAELKLYLYDCQRQGVHPLDRLLHFTKRGGKYTPVTSIDLMRIRAAESGEYAGSDDADYRYAGDSKYQEEEKNPAKATVTVYRLVGGQPRAFAATARWDEYYPGDQSGHMWRKMPHTMLAKCAEALALRKGFPRQLAGLYAAEEMDQANSSAQPPARVQPSKPNGGDSDSRPSGAEALAGATLPADSTVDPDTGEELPEPPSGYHYVSGYTFNAPWHEAMLLKADAQGGSIKISTRLKIGELLAQAAVEHIPVRADLTGKRNSPGHAYLNKIELLKPEETHQAVGITASDIPF